MWAVAFGSMLGTFPFTLLYARFGARLVLFFAGILSALATAAIPLAALLLGFGPLLVLRFLQVRGNELVLISFFSVPLGNCLFSRLCRNGNDLLALGIAQAECIVHLRADLLLTPVHGVDQSHCWHCLQ